MSFQASYLPAALGAEVTSGSAMIAPMRMRGLSEAKGSWKTACTSRIRPSTLFWASSAWPSALA